MRSPHHPFIVSDRAAVCNLEPVPATLVSLEVVVGSPREVDLGRPRVPKHAVLSVAVPRDAEADFGPGQYVDRLGLGGSIKGTSPAGDIWVVDVHLWWRLGELVARGVGIRAVCLVVAHVARSVRVIRTWEIGEVALPNVFPFWGFGAIDEEDPHYFWRKRQFR